MTRRPLIRRVLVGLALLLGAVAAVHVVNHVRLDAGALQANADRVLAHARSLQAMARPEYQDHALAGLGANPRNGPFVRLDAILDRAQLIEIPAAVSAGGALVDALEFDQDARPDLAPANGGLAVSAREGVLSVVTDGDDYLVNSRPLSIPRDAVGDIMIRAKADRGSYLRLAWAGEQGPGDASVWLHRIDLRFSDNRDFHTYVINARNVLKRGLAAGERLSHLYLQPADAPGAKVELDFIRFVPKSAVYAATPHGVGDETIGSELRQALFMRPDQGLQFPVAVPANQPRLDFGMGALLAGAPLRFEVLVQGAGGDVTPIHDATLDQAERWVDARVDLARWAGQEVRLTLRATAAAAGAPNVAFWSSPIVSSAPVQPFNVVVMIEDAERADYLSVYGHPAPTTPFKQRLMAERGIVFEQAIAQAEKTRPSVASFMTSLYPTATGSWHFSDTLSDRYLTLAEVMRAQGYVTASFIQNGNAGPYAGIHQGFDRLLDEVTIGSTTEAVFTGKEVRRFLEGHRDRSFFLYLHAIDPHAQYDPPEPYRGKFGAAIGLPTTPVERDAEFDAPWVQQPSIESRRRYYEGEIAHNDQVVERFFAILDELGLSQNTLVVMTSEHGEYQGERGLLGNRLWSHNPPGYLIGTRVPLMMVYPARFAEAKRVGERVQLLDLMPTVLELAGADATGLMLQGDSLVDLLEGRRADYWRDRAVFSEEPTALLKSNPCACGSTYFRDWHILSSTWMANPVRRVAPQLLSFAATATFAVDSHRPADSLDAAFLPDLAVRWRQRSLITGLREANMATWRKLTSGTEGLGTIDPDTLERLKGLGYVN
jgi:arylsulfatase A-like enzyme